MKKKTKKLSLAKETVRTLELVYVQGGGVSGYCPSREIPCEDEVASVNGC